MILIFASPSGSLAQTSSSEAQVIEPRKIGFKFKHPKIYKAARKARTVCVFIGPIINVAANVVTAAGVLR